MNRPYVPIPTPELRKRVRLLAAAGASDDEVARAYLLRPTELRERFGEELKAGRGEKKPPSPSPTRASDWMKPPRSGTSKSVQLAWLRAQIARASSPVNATSSAPTVRNFSKDNNEKTDLEILEDWRNGDQDAIYDLSDEALHDSIREMSAANASLEPSETTGLSDKCEPKGPGLGAGPRSEDGSTDLPTYPIPHGARRDEVFADVVHDEPKKIERYPNRWSKGEVLDYLFEEATRSVTRKA